MPRGDKSSYTKKQKRQARHIEEGYEDRGVSDKEAERRAKQGVALGHMLYVLHVSLLLAVIAGVFLYLAFFH